MYKLLIVDDNQHEIRGIEKLPCWKQFGFDKILSAENGRDGLELALAEKPLLVITDVQMPLMDGLTMSQKIYEKLPDTKFIFMSCFDDSEYVRGAIDVNAYGYVLKPINISKLCAITEKILKLNAMHLESQKKINLLENQIKENMPILREQLIRDIFYGNMTDFNNTGLEQFNLQNKNFCAVFVVQIDEKSSNEDAEAYLDIMKVKSYFEKTSEVNRVFGVILSKRQLGVLIFADVAADTDSVEDECLEFCDRVKEEINTNLLLDISVCIGGVSRRMEDIPHLFTNAENVLNTSLFTKRNSIVFAEEVESGQNMLDYSARELEAEITELIESGDEEKIQKFVDKYYNSSAVQKKEMIKAFTTSVVGIIQVVFFKMNRNLSEVFGDDFVIWEKLSRFDSILDIRQWIYNIFMSICEHTNERKSSRHENLINDIKKIIGENYSHIDSISDIADMIHVSTVHMNVTFKKYTGETVFDYLTRFKLEKAKELLRKSNSRVYEISEQLGYKSKAYFSSMFKEYTGMSPREYRECEEEADEKSSENVE